MFGCTGDRQLHPPYIIFRGSSIQEHFHLPSISLVQQLVTPIGTDGRILLPMLAGLNKMKLAIYAGGDPWTELDTLIEEILGPENPYIIGLKTRIQVWTMDMDHFEDRVSYGCHPMSG